MASSKSGMSLSLIKTMVETLKSLTLSIMSSKRFLILEFLEGLSKRSSMSMIYLDANFIENQEIFTGSQSKEQLIRKKRPNR